MFTSFYRFRQKKIIPTNELVLAEVQSSHWLLKAALPNSLAQDAESRHLFIEKLFERTDDESRKYQTELLLAYLESLYQEKTTDHKATDTLISQLHHLITSNQANLSHRLIYMLMQIKINGTQDQLEKIAKINQKLFDINETNENRAAFIPVFIHTLSKQLLATLSSQITVGLSLNKEEFYKRKTFMFIENLENTGSSLIKAEWVDSCFTDLLPFPEQCSFEALTAIFKTRPDLLNVQLIRRLERILGVSDEAYSSDQNSYRKMNALELLLTIFEIRPDLITSFDCSITFQAIEYSIKNSESGVLKAALKLIKIILKLQKNQEIVTEPRLNKIISLTHYCYADIRQAAIQVLDEMYKLKPGYVKEGILLVLIPLTASSHFFFNFSDDAIKALTTVFLTKPHLAAPILSEYAKDLNNPEETHRIVASRVLRAVFAAQPNLADHSIKNALLKKLDDRAITVDLFLNVLKTIYKAIKCNPVLIDNELLSCMCNVLQKYSAHAFYALKAIGKVNKERPELIDQSHVDVIFDRIDEFNYYTFVTALHLINDITQAHPNFFTDSNKIKLIKVLSEYECLMLSLDFRDEYKSLISLFKQMPSLASDDALYKKIVSSFGNYLEKDRLISLELCLASADVHPEIMSVENTEHLEAQVFNLYLDAMKLFRPSPTLESSHLQRRFA